MFDKKKLYDTISAKGVSVTKLAYLLEMHQATLFRKIKGESEFTRSEMQRIRESLSLGQKDLDDIFFASELA